MINEKNLIELGLSDEQMKMYKDFTKRENALRGILKKCGVHASAVERIISKSDLNKVDMNNLEALEENIKQTWSDFIIKKD